MDSKEQYVEFLETLLTALLDCGLRDLNLLFEKTMILKELSKEYTSTGILMDIVVKYSKEYIQSEPDYTSIARIIAWMIHNELEKAIEEPDLIEKIEEQLDELIIDYGMISNEILDVLKPEMSRDKMIEVAKEKLKNLES